LFLKTIIITRKKENGNGKENSTQKEEVVSHLFAG
jgi:hypothetical protein